MRLWSHVILQVNFVKESLVDFERQEGRQEKFFQKKDNPLDQTELGTIHSVGNSLVNS